MSVEKTSPGTVHRDIRRPDGALIAAAGKFPAATLHEAGGKIGALPSAIKPVAAHFRLFGPAITVDSPPADNLWLHRAIYVAEPGDVLVVSVRGHYEAGYWGEIMAQASIARKLGGLVIDGCVRDGAILAELGFPVFSRGLCIRGTGKDFAARAAINAPIQIGDVTISAGDFILGDGDGVVAIPAAELGRTIEAAAAREAKEARTIAALQDGQRTLDLYGWGEG